MHEAYWRLVENADTAVLFVHGIAGTPNHFRFFLPLIPDNVSVCALLLEGHGKGVRDFSRTSMDAWEQQVRSAVNALASCHTRIIIAAHSMGTLFAIEQAIREPKVTTLFLMAVPLRIFLRPNLFLNSAKVFFDKIGPEDKVASAARDCYGIGQDRNLLHYLGWIPRYLELFAKIRQTRRILPLLKTPGFAFQSVRDEMVSGNAAADLQRCPALTVTLLPESGHYYYQEQDKALLLETFRQIFA